MTYKQFYQMLAKSRAKFRLVGKRIRSTKRSKNYYCPITSLAKTPSFRNCNYYFDAGRELGLSEEQIIKIADASDGFGSRKIRRTLLTTLRACGKLVEN